MPTLGLTEEMMSKDVIEPAYVSTYVGFQALACDYCGEPRDGSHNYDRCYHFVAAIAHLNNAQTNKSGHSIPPFGSRSAVDHKNVERLVLETYKYA
jgi:hypothetical protein